MSMEDIFMKKMDEMDRNIQLRSEEWGYRVAMLALCAWTLYSSAQALINNAKYNPVPCLIICLASCFQSFSQIAMKQKMIAGDEEYREPNRLLRIVIAAIVIFVIIVSLGTYFLVKA